MRAFFACSLLFVGALSFGACAHSSSATPVKGPDGAEGWYLVRCKEDPSSCNAEAGSVCPEGYEMADDFERQEFEANHPGTADGKLVHCRTGHGSMY